MSKFRIPAHYVSARLALKWMAETIDKPDFVFQLKINVVAIEMEKSEQGTTIRFICQAKEHAANLRAWLQMPGVFAKIKKGYAEHAGTLIHNLTATHEG